MWLSGNLPLDNGCLWDKVTLIEVVERPVVVLATALLPAAQFKSRWSWLLIAALPAVSITVDLLAILSAAPPHAAYCGLRMNRKE